MPTKRRISRAGAVRSAHAERRDDDAGSRKPSFGGCPIYGWEFIDPAEESWSNWRDRLSVDVRLSHDESPHVIDLFQEGGSGKPRHLDLRIWFAQIRITTYEERDIPVPEFIASGVRWWDGLHSGDPRTSGKGSFPLRGE